LIKIAPPLCVARLVRACKWAIEAAAEEAGYRTRDEVLDVDEYIKLRRLNSAIYACFALIDPMLGIELPEEVLNHPILTRVCQSANDMVWIANVSFK
jgi:Terpene synthase family 2, C-terminal metal binding